MSVKNYIELMYKNIENDLINYFEDDQYIISYILISYNYFINDCAIEMYNVVNTFNKNINSREFCFIDVDSMKLINNYSNVEIDVVLPLKSIIKKTVKTYIITKILTTINNYIKQQLTIKRLMLDLIPFSQSQIDRVLNDFDEYINKNAFIIFKQYEKVGSLTLWTLEPMIQINKYIDIDNKTLSFYNRYDNTIHPIIVSSLNLFEISAKKIKKHVNKHNLSRLPLPQLILKDLYKE